MIICTKCKGKPQPTENFYRRSDRDGWEPWCKKCTKKKKKRHYEQSKCTLKGRWAYAKSYAKDRGWKLSLTEAQHGELISKPCNYCKTSLEKEVGIGLDRLDNTKGYELGNVVPCCGPCNQGRSDRFTPQEWQVMIDALIKFRCGR